MKDSTNTSGCSWNSPLSGNKEKSQNKICSYEAVFESVEFENLLNAFEVGRVRVNSK